MVTLKLYKNSDKPNTINKVLGVPVDVTGTFFNTLNVLRPRVNIRGLNAKDFNYCYIVELNRYYFINEVNILDNEIVELNLSIDVLKSYEEEIMATTATLTVGENTNQYISNKQNVYDMKPNFEKIDFLKNKFSETGSIIMITIKGN